jgi:6-oxo-cyclohex-1-ene-carbonyl-CoA hydrolase
VSSDLAVFGQAGPKHGSAPDSGSTDFLPLFVGIERAMQSCTLCESWTAHQALAFGLVSEIVPVLELEGRFVSNPLVATERWLDGAGRIAWGLPKTGAELELGREQLRRGRIDLTPLDRAVDKRVFQLARTMPECLRKTIESVRKHKLEHWDRNKESNRSWLGQNMLSEAAAGFRAFHERPGGRRELDYFDLRRRLADGARWTPESIDALTAGDGGD